MFRKSTTKCTSHVRGYDVIIVLRVCQNQ